MKNPGTLQVTTPSEREIVFTRRFNAPRPLVWDAFTRPELLKRWLFGPDGWSLAVCDMDLRPGGKYRWVWRNQKGTDMGLSGAYTEVTHPERIIATERFDDAWYPGEALITTAFTATGNTTILTQTSLYESQQARDDALKSGMEGGVALSFDRLANLLTTL